MLTEQELQKIAQWMTGEDNPLQAMQAVLAEYAEGVIASYRGTLEKMERKYGLDFGEFQRRLGESLPLSWEHERDYMEWEEAVTNLPEYQRIASQLKAHA